MERSQRLEPIVRDASSEDLQQLTDIYNHYVRASPATFDVVPFTPQQRAEWLSHYGPSGPHRLLVAEADGILGYCTSSRYRPRAAYDTTVEVSAYVHAEAIGRGVGTLLYSTLFAALEGLDLHRAIAGITLPNPASVALHERFGFRQIGLMSEVGRKFGRYWDVVWFEKRIEP